MAAITCAGPREGYAWAIGAHWANLAARSLRHTVGLARQWLSPYGDRSQPAASGGASGGQRGAPCTPPPVRRIAPAPQTRAFGDLLACMSHELRTPLNAVIGFSDLMQRELFGPLGDARYQEYARHIHESGDALLRAAEDALAMTTLVASAPHTASDRVDLSAAFISAWSELTGGSAGRGIGLELAVAPDIEIRADARTMRQALKHLLAAGLARACPGTALRVTAVTAHGRVVIELSVPEVETAFPGSPAPSAPGLALCLARTLFEVQGSTLTEQRRNRRWTARAELEHAVQEDFFACAS